MPTADDIAWFKQQFADRIEAAVAGTPIGIDLVVGIACQETGPMWARARRQGLPVERILALCVGDSIDGDGVSGRRAFPIDKAQLLAAPRGAEMFAIARQALVDLAAFDPGYRGVAAKASKFCRGYGLFQRDLQFFRTDPDYFLEKRYEHFEDTLAHALAELGRGLRKLGLEGAASLDDLQSAALGIAYNTGRFRPEKGLRQGHFNGRQYYGEALFDFIRLSRTVAAPGRPATLQAAAPGQAVVPPPSDVAAEGPLLRVETQTSPLRLRSEPVVSDPPEANVRINLPDGHLVRAVTGRAVRGWMEIETSLDGALHRGWCSAKFLVPAPEAAEVPVVAPSAPAPIPAPAVEAARGAAPAPAPVAEPAPTPGTAGIPPVRMPLRPGRSVRRRDPASAHSLSEARQPGRLGSDPATLRAELDAIIDWLGVDEPAHLRYQPQGRTTFCNVYAHDYCHLAGVYLPRVWWTPGALVRLARGESVEPLIGNTIAEMRANDLFRWLRDFGAGFGWRQTGTLTKLQLAANQGAVALVIARRKNDGQAGHVSAVVPEGGDHGARRDREGEVTLPLQSQAGARNFRRGTGSGDWWRGDDFAEFGFWVHP